MRSLTWAFLAFPFATCSPTVSFPFNSQLPPAARVSTSYSYVFTANTFTSASALTYSLKSAPSWLSVNSSTRRLYGTPPDGIVPNGSNITGVDFTLVAKDGNGEVEMTATLAVSKRAAPALLKTLEHQMTGFGDFSAPRSLLYYPSTKFNFSFDSATFSYPAGEELDYYAVSGDGSPLPAWIHFDANTLMISGTTPPFESLVSPPQIFSLQFVASDVVGFAAIALDFDITVGTRKLSSTEPLVILNVTKGGTEVEYGDLANHIRLDGSPVTPGSGVTVTIDGMPSWLSFNTTTWKLSGSPPLDAESSKFIVSFKDNLADTLGVQIVVNLADSLFTDTEPSIDIVPGKQVDFDLTPYLANASDVALSIDTNQDWLKVEGLKLTGMAPEDLQPNIYQLSLTANSQTLSGVKQTISVQVHVFAETKGPSGKKKNKLTKAQIALVVILPVVCVIMMGFMAHCLLQHRRRRNPRPKTILVEEITGPLPPDLRRDETRTSFDHSPTDSDYQYVQNFRGQQHNSQYSTNPNFNGNTRAAHADSDIGCDHILGTRTMHSFGVGGSRRSESWVTIDGTSRSPSKAYVASRSTRGRDLTFQSEAATADKRSSWYTEGPASSFRRGADLTVPSLPDLGPFPQISEDIEIEAAAAAAAASEMLDRDISMVDIRDDEAQRMGAVPPRDEEGTQNLPDICFGTERSLPDIPSSEALPSIRESGSRTPSPSPLRPAHLPPLVLDHMRDRTLSRPSSSAVTIRPDTAPHPDDIVPTALSLSRKPSLSQAETLPKPPRRPSFTYFPPPEPPIPRKSSRRVASQSRTSLGPSVSGNSLNNMRVSLGPRLSDRHKQPTNASMDSMLGKENQLGGHVSADNWKSGASREYLDIPYRDLYGGTVSGNTRRSMPSVDARPYTSTSASASRPNSLRGGDRRRTMTSASGSTRRKTGSRRTSVSGMSGISDDYMQSIPIGYEQKDVSMVMGPSGLRLPQLDFGEVASSKHSFATAREFQSMSTVNSIGSEPGFI